VARTTLRRATVVVLNNTRTRIAPANVYTIFCRAAGSAGGCSVVASYTGVVTVERLALADHWGFLHRAIIALTAVESGQETGLVTGETGCCCIGCAGFAGDMAAIAGTVNLVLTRRAGGYNTAKEQGKYEKMKNRSFAHALPI